MCELAEGQIGWVHLSTGNLLRAELEGDGPSAGVIESYINEGKLVPNGIVVKLLKDEMERITRTTGRRNFLLDGFPRPLSNVEAWDETFGNDTDLPKMLYLECPCEALEKRILGRAKYSGRSADHIENVKRRFETFKAETLPTVEFFKERNKYAEIDCSLDRTAVYELVREQLLKHIDETLAARPLTERSEILPGLRPWPRSE